MLYFDTHSYAQQSLDWIRVARYGTSVHGMKNEVDESVENRIITTRERFGEADHKFFKHDLKRVQKK